jgi:hypothetical protein
MDGTCLDARGNEILCARHLGKLEQARRLRALQRGAMMTKITGLSLCQAAANIAVCHLRSSYA